MSSKLYKCVAKLKDEYGNIDIHFNEFNVIGQTTDYYIIKTYCKKGSKKVQKNSKNGYAFDSKEKALFNFLKRRERYSGLLEHFVEQNQILIKKIKEQLEIKEVNS